MASDAREGRAAPPKAQLTETQCYRTQNHISIICTKGNRQKSISHAPRGDPADGAPVNVLEEIIRDETIHN